MPNPDPKLKNLKSFKKGEERARAAGRKGGAASNRSIKTILKDFLEMEPVSIFHLTKEEKQVAAELKKQGKKTTKDLIFWKMAQKAQKGDLQAMKMMAEHIEEDPGTLVKISGTDEKPPVQIDQIVKLSVDELEDLQDEIKDKMS